MRPAAEGIQSGGVAATQRACSCLSRRDATRRGRRLQEKVAPGMPREHSSAVPSSIAPATPEARDRPARHLRGAQATPTDLTCPISDSAETASALLVHQSRRCSRRLCRRKMTKVLPKVLMPCDSATRLRFSPMGSASTRPDRGCIVFVIEVVPLGRFKSSDRRRAIGDLDSVRSDGNGVDAAAADCVAVDGATGDDWMSGRQ